VVSTGAFGRDVSICLRNYRDNYDVAISGTLADAFKVNDALVVVATWRPSPAFCRRADELSFEHGRPWIPVVMDQWRVMVGPSVLPPAGPCYECYLRRKAQHDNRPAETAAIYKTLDEDPEAGPRGHLPHHARLAGSLVMKLAESALAGQASVPAKTAAVSSLVGADGLSKSKIIGFDLIGNEISISSVVRCHDCGRCADRNSR
jgi:hypothetical protein